MCIINLQLFYKDQEEGKMQKLFREIGFACLFISNLGGRSNSMKLLLAGMALSAGCGAFSSFIVYFANNKEGMQTIAYWMMGSLAGAKWGERAIIAPIIMASTLCGGAHVFSLPHDRLRG